MVSADTAALRGVSYDLVPYGIRLRHAADDASAAVAAYNSAPTEMPGSAIGDIGADYQGTADRLAQLAAIPRAFASLVEAVDGDPELLAQFDGMVYDHWTSGAEFTTSRELRDLVLADLGEDAATELLEAATNGELDDAGALSGALGAFGRSLAFAVAFTDALGIEGIALIFGEAHLLFRGNHLSQDEMDLVAATSTALLTGLQARPTGDVVRFLDDLWTQEHGITAVLAIVAGEGGDGRAHALGLLRLPAVVIQPGDAALPLALLGYDQIEDDYDTGHAYLAHIVANTDAVAVADVLEVLPDDQADDLMSILVGDDWLYWHPEVADARPALAGDTLEELYQRRLDGNTAARDAGDSLLRATAEMASDGDEEMVELLLNHFEAHPEVLHDLVTASAAGGLPTLTVDVAEVLSELPRERSDAVLNDLIGYMVEHDSENVATSIGHLIGVMDEVGLERDGFAWHEVGIRLIRDALSLTGPHGNEASKAIGNIQVIFGAVASDPSAATVIANEAGTDLENFMLGFAVAVEANPDVGLQVIDSLGDPPDLERLVDWIEDNNASSDPDYAFLSSARQYAQQIENARDF